MGSQTDLDQGGTFRQQNRVYLGPSVGWQWAPSSVILPIITGGTTIVQRGNSLITLNFNGLITVQLPPAKSSLAGAQANPGTFVAVPITIVDIGGFCSVANPATIQGSGSELVDGLASVSLQSPYGAFVLQPDIIHGGWILTQ